MAFPVLEGRQQGVWLCKRCEDEVSGIERTGELVPRRRVPPPHLLTDDDVDNEGKRLYSFYLK